MSSPQIDDPVSLSIAEIVVPPPTAPIHAFDVHGHGYGNDDPMPGPLHRHILDKYQSSVVATASAPAKFVRRWEMPEKAVVAMHTRYFDRKGPENVESQTYVLPDEVLLQVLILLGTHDLRAAALACSRWFLVTRSAFSTRHLRIPSCDPIHLTDQQRTVLHCATVKRSNIFFTGDAGTGKSYLFRVLQAQFDKMGIVCDVIAPTGAAARNVEGSTIHEFLGLGIGYRSEGDLDEISKAIPVHVGVERLRRVSVLLIEEVSMVSRALFEFLDLAARCFRGRKGEVFGGMQVIVTGDFAQLPPVGDNDADTEAHYTNFGTRAYCFESAVWQQAFGNPYDDKNPRTFLLTTQMRQSADTEFVALLNALRTRSPGNWVQSKLKTREQAVVSLSGEDFSGAMYVVPHKKTAAERNQKSLKDLAAKTSTVPIAYPAIDRSHQTAANGDEAGFLAWFLGGKCRVPEKLELIDGARVVLLRNFSKHKLFNGSVGYVRAMIDTTDEAQATELFARLTDPQSSQFFKGANNGRRRFALLSDGSHLLCFHQQMQPFCRVCNCKDSLNPCDEGSIHKVLPVVEFDSQPDVHYLVMPSTLEFYRRVSVPDVATALLTNKPAYKSVRMLIASRKQLPMMLGYATTVHSIQGLTLDKLAVSLRGCWEPSMVYVALSRVRNLRSMCIVSMPDWRALYADESTFVPALYRLFAALDALRMREQTKRQKEKDEAELQFAMYHPPGVITRKRRSRAPKRMGYEEQLQDNKEDTSDPPLKDKKPKNQGSANYVARRLDLKDGDPRRSLLADLYGIDT